MNEEEGGGRGLSEVEDERHVDASPSGSHTRRPGGGKVNLLPDAEDGGGERLAQREGGRRLAGRAGRRNWDSKGGATGERGRSCGWQRWSRTRERMTKEANVLKT